MAGTFYRSLIFVRHSVMARKEHPHARAIRENEKRGCTTNPLYSDCKTFKIRPINLSSGTHIKI